MEISKDFGDKKLIVYQPDEKEREKLSKISDEIIDLIESHNLEDVQQIHLVSSLYESMKEVFDVEAMRHLP